MLLPFTKTDLNVTDYFYNFACAYKNLIDLPDDEIRKTRNRIKKDYLRAANQLKEFALDDDRWNHIDDLCRLLDMFYPGSMLAKYLDDDKQDIDKFYIKYISDIA